MPSVPITIICDTLEKKPLPIPAFHVCWDQGSSVCGARLQTLPVRVIQQALPTGDYALQGHEKNTLIERKASWRELSGNLLTTEGRRRFTACLVRLRSECSNPILFLEGDISSYAAPTRDCNPVAARDILLHTLLEHRVPLMTFPTGTPAQRRTAAEWVVSILHLNACYTPATP